MKSYWPTPWMSKNRHGDFAGLDTWCTVAGVTVAA
jgi:hypothetical protein